MPVIGDPQVRRIFEGEAVVARLTVGALNAELVREERLVGQRREQAPIAVRGEQPLGVEPRIRYPRPERGSIDAVELVVVEVRHGGEGRREVAPVPRACPR